MTLTVPISTIIRVALAVMIIIAFVTIIILRIAQVM